jgi:hypothetical protein
VDIATSAFGRVVSTEHVSITSPAGSRERSYNPAKAADLTIEENELDKLIAGGDPREPRLLISSSSISFVVVFIQLARARAILELVV